MTIDIDIINHTLEVFDSSASRNDEDYCERLEGEIDSQHFPNFPLRRERAFCEKTCNVEDENSLKFMCEKDFPSHSTLTPGLLIMTCACPKKIVYGFTLMTSGESPQMIFDLILSRFPTDYSPNIIYDNACKAKGRVQNKMEISNGIFHEGGSSCVPLTFFSIFLLKKYLELSPSRIGWKLVILRVVLVAGGGGGSDA